MRCPKIRGRSLVVVPWLLLAAGCGSSHPSSVSGTVTLDGKPLSRGTVVFHPVGDGPLAYGMIDTAGQYTLHTGAKRGLAAGDYKVTVVATTDPILDRNVEPLPKLLTPQRYSDKDHTGLRFQIKPGNNQIDLVLRSS